MKRRLRALIRAWRWLWCNHHNSQKEWSVGDGWHIKVCTHCGRAVIFTENDLRHNPHHTTLP